MFFYLPHKSCNFFSVLPEGQVWCVQIAECAGPCFAAIQLLLDLSDRFSHNFDGVVHQGGLGLENMQIMVIRIHLSACKHSDLKLHHRLWKNFGITNLKDLHTVNHQNENEEFELKGANEQL